VTLRLRISIFVFCAVMLLTIGFLFGEFRSVDLLEARIQSLILDNQVTAWEEAIGATESQLTTEAQVVMTIPGIAQAAQDKDTASLERLLRPVVASGAITRIDLLDADGNLVYSSDPEADGAAMIDAGLVYKISGGSDTNTGLQRDHKGQILATVARPLMGAPDPNDQGDATPQTIGVLVLADTLASTLDRLKSATNSDILLLGMDGKPRAGTAPDLWSALTPARARLHPGVLDIDTGARVLRVDQTVLNGGSGDRLGYELSVTDVTQSYRRDRGDQLMSYIVIAILVIGTQVSLFWYLSRTFRPLSDSMYALNALTAGDTSVDIVGEESQDEVGRLAQLTRLVRDLKRADLRDEQMRRRQSRRQERFIRNEMIGLASALSEDARAELMQDVQKIEAAQQEEGAGEGQLGSTLGSLAVAFRYMAERVKTQYHSLDKLVAELRDALATKTELIGLQQQFEIAGQMQAAILPKTWPPREDVEIEGRLLPAKEFGGNFYDFFLLDRDRLMVVAAEISGKGLATAFLAVVARTLLKATLLMDPVPETALRRVNATLLAENDQRLELRLFAAILDLGTGRLTYCAAGYPAPLVLRRLGDVAEPPLTESRPLAVSPEVGLAQGVLELPARTTLVLSSNGVAEATNSLGQALGREGLIEILRGVDDLGARTVCDAITRNLSTRGQGRAREADASCVVLRYLGR
jgi:sigma-B regulation protein RsbU (phosphoserine phosphatase)